MGLSCTAILGFGVQIVGAILTPTNPQLAGKALHVQRWEGRTEWQWRRIQDVEFWGLGPLCGLGLGVQGLGIRVWSLGIRALGLGVDGLGSRFLIINYGCRSAFTKS